MGILLSELLPNEIKTSKDLSPHLKAKLNWQDPNLPQNFVYRELWLRSVAKESSRICDFEAKISCIDNSTQVWLIGKEDENLAEINERIKETYMLSNAKLHDSDWYVGEPCIAHFDWDHLWYRAVVTSISKVKTS